MSEGRILYYFSTLLVLNLIGLIFDIQMALYVAIGFSISGILEVFLE